MLKHESHLVLLPTIFLLIASLLREN